MISANEALDRLREGNQRFSAGSGSIDTRTTNARRGELVQGQEPFAVVLGCSDSRVPVELVFDQGLGDLFVVRVAGNIAAPSQVGSIEFCAESFGTKLVVVLGHSQCGAVAATVDQLQQPSENVSANLRSVVDRIRPSVESLVEQGQDVPRARLLAQAVRANVRSCVDHLQHGSPILEELIAKNGLMVVGAEYSLETGEVDFF